MTIPSNVGPDPGLALMRLASDKVADVSRLYLIAYDGFFSIGQDKFGMFFQC